MEHIDCRNAEFRWVIFITSHHMMVVVRWGEGREKGGKRKEEFGHYFLLSFPQCLAIEMLDWLNWPCKLGFNRRTMSEKQELFAIEKRKEAAKCACFPFNFVWFDLITPKWLWTTVTQMAVKSSPTHTHTQTNNHTEFKYWSTGTLWTIILLLSVVLSQTWAYTHNKHTHNSISESALKIANQKKYFIFNSRFYNLICSKPILCVYQCVCMFVFQRLIIVLNLPRSVRTCSANSFTGKGITGFIFILSPPSFLFPRAVFIFYTVNQNSGSSRASHSGKLLCFSLSVGGHCVGGDNDH